jgi:hypothetical protein
MRICDFAERLGWHEPSLGYCSKSFNDTLFPSKWRLYVFDFVEQTDCLTAADHG